MTSYYVWRDRAGSIPEHARYCDDKDEGEILIYHRDPRKIGDTEEYWCTACRRWTGSQPEGMKN